MKLNSFFLFFLFFTTKILAQDKNDFDWISILSLNGAGLVSEFNRLRIPCEKFKEPAYQLAVLQKDTRTFNEAFIREMTNCLKIFPKDHFLIGHLKNITVIPDAEKNLIQRYKEILNRKQASRDNYLSDLQFIEQHSSGVFKDLMRVLIFSNLGNIAKAENILHELINTNLIELQNRDTLPVSSARAEFQDLNFKLLENLKQLIGDSVLFKALIVYLYDYYTDPELIQYLETLQIDNLKDDIGLKYIQHKMGGFAHYLVYKYVRESRRDSVVAEIIKEFPRTDFLLEKIIANPGKHSLQIIQELNRLRGSSDVLEQMLFYEVTDSEMGQKFCLENPTVKTYSLDEKQKLLSDWFLLNPRSPWVIAKLLKLNIFSSTHLKQFLK